MASPGYVYDLVNPSLPDCVKLGKTTRDVSTRAQGISAATGVPTPFIVVYEMFFEDCDLAESWVHARLESRGARLSNNREFFSISPTIAINAINEAVSTLSASAQQVGENEPAYNDEGNNSYYWQEIHLEADAYYYGNEETIPDIQRAITLYKRAAKLGSEKAYVILADIFASNDGPAKSPEQGIEWLNQGADRGFQNCILALAEIYGGRNIYFPRSLHNQENEIRSYRRFFKTFDATKLSDRDIYIHLKQYLTAIHCNPDIIDREIAPKISNELRARIKNQGYDQVTVDAKLTQINALMKLHRWVKC